MSLGCIKPVKFPSVVDLGLQRIIIFIIDWRCRLFSWLVLLSVKSSNCLPTVTNEDWKNRNCSHLKSCSHCFVIFAYLDKRSKWINYLLILLLPINLSTIIYRPLSLLIDSLFGVDVNVEFLIFYHKWVPKIRDESPYSNIYIFVHYGLYST